MNAVVCESCGSNDLYEENGYRICKYCGTKHLILQEDRPAKHSAIELNNDVSRLLQKCKDDPANASKYARLILEIDPYNNEAKGYLNKQTSFNGGNQSKGCYVATAVYGSYDCPQVWTLRRYRDYALAETWYGRAFIHTYYAISPTLVKWFGTTEWFKSIWKPKLDKMVKRLNDEGVADTPYQDRKW